MILIQLEVALVVRHLKRRLTKEARLADDLTRNDIKGKRRVARYRQKGFLQTGWPPALEEWLNNPTFGPDVKWKLLADFK